MRFGWFFYRDKLVQFRLWLHQFFVMMQSLKRSIKTQWIFIPLQTGKPRLPITGITKIFEINN